MTYEFVEEIGRGGFGIVEKVLNDEGEAFARKKLNLPSAEIHPGVDEDQLTRRFAREVRQQSAIDHHNIVKVIEHDLGAVPPYYIMDLAECTLKEELDNDRTLGGDPKKALFDVLAGLEALHLLGFSHRDLKPANILRYGDDEPFYAISDFGLITGSDSQTTTLTATGAGGGTAYYAAPECVNNFHRATNKSDIYSFGAILHDIFGGGQTRVPYSRLSVQEPNVAPIVEKCTESLPHRRYQDVSELRDDLYLALNSEDLTFISQEEEHLVSILDAQEVLNDEEWDRLCVFLEDSDADGTDSWRVFRSLTVKHLQNLLDNSSAIFHAVGSLFCNYVLGNEGRFDFGMCDVYANKLRIFYQDGDTSLKSKSLISLLVMGASHNRWYVEQMFWTLITDGDISENTMQRFCIDIDVTDVNVSYYINHIAESIGVSIDNLPGSIKEMMVQV